MPLNRIAAYVDAADIAAVGLCSILAGHWLQVIFLAYVLTSYRQRDNSSHDLSCHFISIDFQAVPF